MDLQRYRVTDTGMMSMIAMTGIPGSEMGHGDPEKGGRPLLPHRPVEEAEQPGGVPRVAPRVDHLGTQVGRIVQSGSDERSTIIQTRRTTSASPPAKASRVYSLPCPPE